jgi:hypothetical protein
MSDDDLDGCDLDFTEDPVSDEDLPYLALFADALDPNTETTIAQAEADWAELFGRSS